MNGNSICKENKSTCGKEKQLCNMAKNMQENPSCSLTIKKTLCTNKHYSHQVLRVEQVVEQKLQHITR